MIINYIKKEMKKLILFLLLFNYVSGHGPHGHGGDHTDSNTPSNPDHLINYLGEFTDADGDGMTDFAETKYGFDPADANSVPNKSTGYFLDDLGLTPSDIVDDPEVSSENDRVYCYFSRFNSDIESKTRDFMIKLFPIMYDRLGNPSRNFVCKLHNRGGNRGSWSTNSSGTRLYADDTWNPRLLVHELVHVWSGKYRFASNSNWQWNNMLSGFEEIAEGIAYEIINDYIMAYPNDINSINFVRGGAWDEWSGRFSNYDLVKHQRWTGGGDFWIDPMTSNDRYNISAVLFQVFMAHDKDFYKKVMSKFYETINNDPTFRPNRENIIALWASVLPVVNGIPTEHYLNAMPVLNGRKLDPEFYAIALPDAKMKKGGTQKLFCAFPDAKKGEFWWSSSIYDSNINDFEIPSWFGKFKASDNYYYTDNRKQPYVVNIHNGNGEFVTRLDGELGNPTRSDGGPSTMATSIPSGLNGVNYELGLFRMTLEFPSYKDYTKHYTEDSYFFGYKGFVQDKATERTVIIGIDCDSKTDSAELFLNGNSYSGVLENGAVVFKISSFNDTGVADILIHSNSRNRTNTYKRAIMVGGTADNYRHQPILIIDRDFDGVEDLYEIYREVVAFDPNDTTDSNDTTVVVTIITDSNKTSTDDENATLVVVVDENATSTDDENATLVVVVDENATSTDDENATLVSAVKTDVVETYSVDVNASWEDGRVKISWNEHPTSTLYLELLYGQTRIIYGGHFADRATFVLADHNLTGNETLEGRFLEYSSNSDFIASIGDFVLDLQNVVPIETIDVAVETNGTTIIVENVVSIEIDDSNTTIINTIDNVVLIQNTETITDVTEDNSSVSTDDNVVVITDDNVTLTTNDNETYEENATNSVITVTDEEITIEDDSSKVVELGGDAPNAPPVVKSAWDKAISVGNNWYHLDWFGYFFKVEGNNWIYHETLGWMYTEWTTSFESIWLYHDSFGWVWTKSDLFPYLFNPSESSWVYLVKGGYYDFTQNTWIKL